MSSRLRALIVDDEAPARRAMEHMLQELPAVEVAGTAGDGLQALEWLAHHGADLLLLDIEMPVLAGLDLVTRISPAVSPAVIFVTAYAHYAAQAFEVGAIDYLLKPVDPQRLAQAIERVDARRRMLDNAQRIDALERALQAAGRRGQTAAPEQVWVELGRGRLRLALAQIEWFAADGDYVQAHTAERSYLMRDSLSHLERILGAGFLRVHRSTLVNIDAVLRITTGTGGQLLLTMRNGAELSVGRRTRKTVRNVLGT